MTGGVDARVPSGFNEAREGKKRVELRGRTGRTAAAGGERVGGRRVMGRGGGLGGWNYLTRKEGKGFFCSSLC